MRRMDPATLKAEILRLSRDYSRQVHAAQLPGKDLERPPFVPGAA